MADKEERILITKCSSHCHALRVSCDPFDGNDGMYCDKRGKWVRITEKDCAKCKSPVLCGISRAEAVYRMAKAACKANRRCIGGVCETCTSDMPKGYIHSSEAELDAILGGKNG